MVTFCNKLTHNFMKM